MPLPYTLEQYQQMEERLVKHIGSRIPKFEIKVKQTSILMKLLSILLFFVKDFQTGFATTIYPKVYFPVHYVPPHSNERSAVNYIETLAHEYVHLSDRKRLKQWFNLFYLSPQILALLVLLSFSSLWWLLALVSLVPIPSLGRTWLEFRGYRMSMAVCYWLTGEKTSSESMVKYFTGPDYYFMCPFKKYLIRKFDKTFEMIKSGENLPPELKEVKDVLLT